MTDGIPCIWMRGGTSKGGYFLASDMPSDVAERDRLLLSIMGSPDPRQIDGMGGADPLTSKAAIVSRSDRPGIDINYLFLQVVVDKPQGEETEIVILMENTNQVVTATIRTPGGKPIYRGEASIDGVPGTAAPVVLNFHDAAGLMCGALLPTGRPVDRVAGVDVTLVDNGMPVVVLKAEDVGITGYEDRAALEGNEALRKKLEEIRLESGPLMNLGDVKEQTVPKMTMVAPPRHGGVVTTRTFIPHRAHASIGVFGALSVATACLLPGSPAAEVAEVPEGRKKTMAIEHPIGAASVVMEVEQAGNLVQVVRSGIISTARKLFEGNVFPHQ